MTNNCLSLYSHAENNMRNIQFPTYKVDLFLEELDLSLKHEVNLQIIRSSPLLLQEFMPPDHQEGSKPVKSAYYWIWSLALFSILFHF